jgi:DNA-binding beta-propeller fold protein YncE
VDAIGNIYVTWPSRSKIRVFKQDGTLVGDFGTGGTDIAQFNVPAGIWVDPQNRIYVADKNNRRVQVFQIKYTPGATLASPATRGR